MPVLALPSGQVIAESVAILLALDETFPEARLLPQHGSPARNVAVQWLVFMTANIYPDALRFLPSRTLWRTPHRKPPSSWQAGRDMDRRFRAICLPPIRGPFLLGARMTITDVYAAMLAELARPGACPAEDRGAHRRGARKRVRGRGLAQS